jgi:hypothetical protein
MIWITIQWSGFVLRGETWQFLPHAVGEWFSSLCDFNADSECTLILADDAYASCLRVHDRILVDDALAERIQATNRAIDVGRIFGSNVSQMFALMTALA